MDILLLGVGNTTFLFTKLVSSFHLESPQSFISLPNERDPSKIKNSRHLKSNRVDLILRGLINFI